MTEEEYGKLAAEAVPKSPIGKDCRNAFLVGGGICLLGQILQTWYGSFGLSKENAGLACSITLIAAAALLTGLGLFDNIGNFAGAGTLVPITGFANSISACALEFQTEGYILGVGSRMFAIAGPVIVYGTAASAVYGFVYWVTTLF